MTGAASTLPGRLLGWLVFSAIVAVGLFGAAGRWDMPALWALAAIVSGGALACLLALPAGELSRRHRRGPGDAGLGTTALLRLTGPGSVLFAAADSGRLGWSGPVPSAFQAAGLALVAGSLALALRAIVVNRWFTDQLRVQKEKGHRVVTSGPYRLVRHPAYAGLLVGHPAAMLAIGSWWALVGSAIFMAVILRRTAIEDGMLLRELDGYAQYAARVRSRLVPGLW